MIAQSVADILRDRVKLSVEGIDRMYLSCRYRHDKYNAAFQIMPSNFRIALTHSKLLKV
jgi:hypothetical protein